MESSFEFKKPVEISRWLRAALEFEQKKYASNPIYPDIDTRYNFAQAWGFIVAGYFLLELSLKALLHQCNCKAERIHELYRLFDKLPDEQKNILRNHYFDFVKIFPKLGQDAPNEIDDFLKNLDGDRSQGSFDWRYYLIEERDDVQLPFIGINLIHEIVYSIYATHRAIWNKLDKPEDVTYSVRLHEGRRKTLLRWYEHQRCLPDWTEMGDRIEKLWGPDYANRYTYVVIQDTWPKPSFGVIPDDLVNEFPVRDMRRKFQSFQESFYGSTNVNGNSQSLAIR